MLGDTSRSGASALLSAAVNGNGLGIGPVCVVGLGYVGSVVAASLAAKGQRVFGVDRRAPVVDAMARGIAPIAEPGLEERIARGLSLGTLTCTTDLRTAVLQSSGSLVCVGTPSGPDGRLREADLLDALEEIAATLQQAGSEHPVHHIVVRSTVPPGMHARACERLQKRLGAAFGDRVTLTLNPEFLREGTAVRDLEEPELVVYATEQASAATWIEALYHDQKAQLRRTDPPSAEVLKLVCNAWHALKVSFANEVARLAGPTQVDPFAVMELLVQDRKLNTSAAYLRPGMPFGGACLTKDVAALSAHARAHGVELPVINGILPSNQAHLTHLATAVLEHRPQRVAVIGIGFKPGAADVRDSAPVSLVRVLLDAGVHVSVADAAVLAATVPPVGIDALRAALGDPRAHPVSSVREAVEGADVVVVGHPSAADRQALVALRPSCPVLDSAGELSRALSAEERAVLAPVVVLSRGGLA